MNTRSTPYEEVIDYLFEQLPAYQRIGPRAFKKNLGNIRALLHLLSEPQKSFRSIHIAGTNGKGSVSNMLASVLQESGYRTGLYTSPHIADFRERIQVNGRMIHKNSVIAFVRKMKPAVREIRPSFFEWTVALAFDHFARQKVDIAVVETGLGGRLDSTNIIEPELSVITNIGLEHTAMLGNTLGAIAAEKAGIIKPRTPVVIGRNQAETAPVFKSRASELNAPVQWADNTYRVLLSERRRKFRKICVENMADGTSGTYELDLTGAYQAENAVTVLAAVDVLKHLGFRIGKQALREGLRRATVNNVFRGRWQEIGRDPRVIADGAHNADGFVEIRKQLALEDYTKLHIIYGCVNDKDLGPILDQLPQDADYYITQPGLDRARPFAEVARIFEVRGFNIVERSTIPQNCLSKAVERAGKKDLILIAGSIFLLSDFL